MTSELLKIISALPEELFFYLEEGALKDRVITKYLDEVDARVELLDFDYNLSLRVKRGSSSCAPTFSCRFEADGFLYQVILSPEDLSAEETNELIGFLESCCSASSPRENGPGRSIVRKKKAAHLLGIAEASKSLGLTHRLLKSLIPCSETRISKSGDERKIEEYYWDKDLISRFQGLATKAQAGRGYDKEDLAFIAESCCDGDYPWAYDCITRFLLQFKFSQDISEDHA